ncbi:MAG: AAA family ATPase [Planctomycetes bacterium]|nr:AAA family ATPase [Planctomycetota bacterium]MBU4398601.1 AAA family ATPase [Planctomycetota bacterium]MCG2685585.1 AAA family ATPase [Planctomycetales bacterium]
MIVTRLKLLNWRNFQKVDVTLGERVFLIGPNASGKSNLLDAFRFLRDIAKSGGGLQKAIGDREGVTKIRCLAARRHPNIEIEVHLADEMDGPPTWRYSIGFKQQPRGDRKPLLTFERVWQGEKMILDRPDEEDKKDPLRLTETHLEQISANAEFREIAQFLETILYLHLVPQLVRHPREFSGPGIPGDPFGRNFLERIAKTPENTRRSRLRRIEKALHDAVPQLKELTHVIDTQEGGVPHLEAVYEHWRPHGAKQRERDFSDGTLRLIGLLWSLLESDSLLLLEEPELSLHTYIVTRLPALIYRLQRKRKRQVIISTHSFELLSDKGIGGEETLLLTPGLEGTGLESAASKAEIRALLDSGLSVAEAALAHTAPPEIRQLELFE